MSQARPTPEPSEIAGRYQVVQKLGAGAFGTVYKAKDKILGRMLAIKTIRMEGLVAAGADLDEMLKRFKQEAQVAAQLKHPNIVTIYDIGDADGMSYLAMEFIDGVGLDKIISTTGKIPSDRAAALGAQVADALDFAHRHKVVHRDIKPANIMVEPGDRVKVADFGIAKATDSGEHLTMTGSLLGTPSYMSPEQAKGAADLDGKSDLFSLGCVLYEMVGGKKAFRGESITALIFKIITEEPPPIRDLEANVSDEMVRIIAKALAKDAKIRYQSGRELADDLLALTRAGSSPTVRQVETPTAPASASPLASPTIRTSPTIQAPPTLHETPTRVAPPPLPRPAPMPSPAPQRAAAVPARKSGSGAGLLIGLALAGLLLLGLAAGGGWYFFLRRPATTTAADVPGPVATLPSATAAPAPALPASSVASTPAAPEVAPAPTTVPASKSVEARTPSTPESRSARADAPPRTAPPAPVGPSVTEAPLPIDDAPVLDGRASGEGVAQKYRGAQGYGGGTSGYGAGGNLRRRERIPSHVSPAETPAVRTLSQIVNAEEAFSGKHGRYGTFAEMVTAQTLFLDVPHQGGVVMRPGYRITLEVTKDGFRALATPLAGGRFFVGDDSGFIRPGTE